MKTIIKKLLVSVSSINFKDVYILLADEAAGYA